MVVLYVDDCGIAAPEQKYIDEFITALENKGFTLTWEGSFSEFLGIKFTENKEAGTITLTQKGLIKKIIAATGMEDCNPNWTPASTTTLGIDPDGELMTDEWSYPSIVGLLLYLSTNTRPDIAFAVSQVARFSYSPKQSHVAMRRQSSRSSVTCLVLGTRERLCRRRTVCSLIVMLMLILLACTTATRTAASPAPSRVSDSLFLLVECRLCGGPSCRRKSLFLQWSPSIQL